MNRKSFLLFLCLTTCLSAFSTPQRRDVLYWNGATYHVYPFIDIESRLEEQKLAKLKEMSAHGVATSNWRGYYFEFEIENDTLFFSSIKSNHDEDLTWFVLNSRERIPMDYFSDTLFLGYGDTFYDGQFPTMIYDSEITMVIENGKVKSYVVHKNKCIPSPLPDNTKMLLQLIYSNIRWNELDEQVLREGCHTTVSFATDTLGHVGNEALVQSSGHPSFDEEALRIISSLPNFSAFFVCGKYLTRQYFFRIDFTMDNKQRFGDRAKKNYDYLCLQGVLKNYFDCNLEYPNTVDELLFFYGNYSTDNGNDKSFIRFIQQEKEKLQFRSNWINAWKEELAVVFDGDTIINMTDERDYFDLFLLASNYYYYNDDYPVSMDDLVIYDSLSKSDYRNNHNKAMISFLSKHKQEIKLISSDYDMLIMMEKDTILYYPGGDVKARCYSSSPQYKLVYRFFDHQNHYAYTEELEKYFRYGIRVLALDFAPYEGDYSDVHLMVYTKENGLQPYCEDDDVRLDSDWFVVLGKYLKGFLCQYDLGKVVFGVLELHR